MIEQINKYEEDDISEISKEYLTKEINSIIDTLELAKKKKSAVFIDRAIIELKKLIK